MIDLRKVWRDMQASHRRWFLVGCTVLALLAVLAFFTNPDQATHLKAIREIVALRYSKYEGNVTLQPVTYNNYLVFSTTTSLGGLTLTYGYFGRIQTTNYAVLAAY